jgi:hypothetical protein
MTEAPEREFLGGQKGKMWTYLILMVVLVAIAIVINLVWKNPTAAREGFNHFLGLPAWALATTALLVGLIIYWLGLKIETDWPEAIGAFLISASITWFEFIVGWNKFALGGLVVLPYIIPVLTFALLLVYGMKKSV